VHNGGFDMVKMIIKILALIFVAALLSACNRQPANYHEEDSGRNQDSMLIGNENTAAPLVLDVAEDASEISYEPKHEVIEFVVLPNGTRVDTRVDSEVVDLVFRHFEAIENGDVVAFRETLQGQDGASINMHLALIARYFWDIVVADYQYEMFYDGDIWAGMTELGRRRIFYEEFPPVSRNTGMFVKEIRQPDNGWVAGVMVTLLNYRQNETAYLLGLISDFDLPGIEWSQILE
jgi:hypothetical protein